MRDLRRRAALAAVLVVTGACADGSAPRAPAPVPADSGPAGNEVSTPADAPVAAPADTLAGSAWTAGVVDRRPGGGGQATLESVTAARHAEFDRVVWRLSEMPGVHLEYIDRPVRECGSGHPVALPGDGWLEVRLEPARAHTEEGRPTVPQRRIEARLPVVLEIVRTCDFEAVVTWVVAVGSPEPFRLLQLDDPSRIVVDIRHPSR